MICPTYEKYITGAAEPCWNNIMVCGKNHTVSLLTDQQPFGEEHD